MGRLRWLPSRRKEIIFCHANQAQARQIPPPQALYSERHRRPLCGHSLPAGSLAAADPTAQAHALFHSTLHPVSGFSFAHIWKAQAVNQICIRLDSLRSRQQELLERLKTQQLTFQEITLYSKIEPLAREVLGMRPSPVKPVVIAPLQESVGSTRTAATIHSSAKRD